MPTRIFVVDGREFPVEVRNEKGKETDLSYSGF